MNQDTQLLADSIHLVARDMVCSIGQLGKLNGNGDCITRISEIAGNLDALDRLLLLIKYQRHRVIRLEIALDDQTHSAWSAIWLHGDIAFLIGLLERLRVRLSILLAEGGNLLPIGLKFVRFLFDDTAFDSAAARLWCCLGIEFGLLLLSIRTYPHLELLSLLNIALQADGLLLQPITGWSTPSSIPVA